jgi:uncharacterized protein DUF2188
MGRTSYEVVPDGDQWVVREGKRTTPPLDSKELAVDAAVRRAKDDAPAKVVVHSEDGAIEVESTFD